MKKRLMIILLIVFSLPIADAGPVTYQTCAPPNAIGPMSCYPSEDNACTAIEFGKTYQCPTASRSTMQIYVNFFSPGTTPLPDFIKYSTQDTNFASSVIGSGILYGVLGSTCFRYAPDTNHAQVAGWYEYTENNLPGTNSPGYTPISRSPCDIYFGGCVGNVKSNAILCPNSDKFVSGDVARIFVGSRSSCTTTGKCEYYCPSGADCSGLPQCALPDNCAASTGNALAKPTSTCSSGFTCVSCNAGYYFDTATNSCKASCSTLHTGVDGGCTSSYTTTDSTNLGEADCAASTTDTCVSCNAGYIFEGGKCVLGCQQQEETCSSKAGCCPTNTDVPPRMLYCSNGLDGKASQGYCCPEGQYYNPVLGRCADPNVCITQCPIDIKLASGLFNPVYFSSTYFGKCLLPFINALPLKEPFKEACVENPNLGIKLKVYQQVHVLDVNGNRVS